MQAEELIARALRQNFHTAVVIITDPAGYPEDVCLALDEPAETDALHASVDKEPARLNRLFGGSHFV
jgi:hypothetical protein